MVGTKLQKRKGLGFWERFSTMPLGIPYGKHSRKRVFIGLVE